MWGLIADPPAGTYRELPYDPEGARALIAESGFDTSQTIRWITWGDPGPRALAFQEYYADVGLDVQFLRIDVAAVVEELYESRNWDLSMHTSAASTPWKTAGSACGAAGTTARPASTPPTSATRSSTRCTRRRRRFRMWRSCRKRGSRSPSTSTPRGTMVAGPVDYGTVRNIYHRRMQGPLWQQTYVQPVRSPVERTWIDPRWGWQGLQRVVLRSSRQAGAGATPMHRGGGEQSPPPRWLKRSRPKARGTLAGVPWCPRSRTWVPFPVPVCGRLPTVECAAVGVW